MTPAEDALRDLLRVIHGPDSALTDELGLVASAARAEDIVRIWRCKVEHFEKLFQLVCQALLEGRTGDRPVRKLLL